MNGELMGWDPEVANQLLARQAQEDIRAGIYDSAALAVRARLKYLGSLGFPRRLHSAYDQERAEISSALNAELPYVPLYRRGRLLAALELYKTHPDTGVMLPESWVTVMTDSKLLGGTSQVMTTFTPEQAQQLLDHLVELQDHGLHPWLATR